MKQVTETQVTLNHTSIAVEEETQSMLEPAPKLGSSPLSIKKQPSFESSGSAKSS